MSIYGAMFSRRVRPERKQPGHGHDFGQHLQPEHVATSTPRPGSLPLVTEGASLQRYSPGGVSSNPFQLVDRQGLLQASQSPTDLAISGRGFFVVNTSSTPSGGTYMYSRAGQFSVMRTVIWRTTTASISWAGQPCRTVRSMWTRRVADGAAARPDQPDQPPVHPGDEPVGHRDPDIECVACAEPAGHRRRERHPNLTVLVYDSLGSATTLLWNGPRQPPPRRPGASTQPALTRADNGAASLQGATLASHAAHAGTQSCSTVTERPRALPRTLARDPDGRLDHSRSGQHDRVQPWNCQPGRRCDAVSPRTTRSRPSTRTA